MWRGRMTRECIPIGMHILYIVFMSSQIAIRLNDEELAILDAEVANGRALNRSDAVRRSITYLDRYRGYRQDADIMSRIRMSGEELYPDLASIPPSDLSGID